MPSLLGLIRDDSPTMNQSEIWFSSIQLPIFSYAVWDIVGWIRAKHKPEINQYSRNISQNNGIKYTILSFLSDIFLFQNICECVLSIRVLYKYTLSVKSYIWKLNIIYHNLIYQVCVYEINWKAFLLRRSWALLVLFYVFIICRKLLQLSISMGSRQQSIVFYRLKLYAFKCLSLLNKFISISWSHIYVNNSMLNLHLRSSFNRLSVFLWK